MEPVVIDGSILEGGGQTLRISSALSAILGVPIRIHSIRAGRSTPGLRPQHLTGLNLIKDLTNGSLEGGNIGSTEITLRPSQISGGEFSVDTKTAGSITLIVQAILPCLLFAGKKSVIKMKGGTNVEMSPPLDYFTDVFSSVAKRFGISFSCKLIKRGFYPKGCGEVDLTVEPVKRLSCVTLDQPQTLKCVNGVSFVAGTIPIRVANEMAHSATLKIHDSLGNIPVNIHQFKEIKAFGNGAALILSCETADGMLLGGTGLGKPRNAANQVGQEAADELIESCFRKVCLDQYAQDQVIIFMALAEGISKVLVGPPTLHTRTAIHVTSQLTGVKFDIIDLKTQPETFIIECKGMGFVNTRL
ncbi:RNA 3'-terminal phosphate cyclase isoform X1 [Daphnia magna]|uniref:RNA 3'-terminal phosphate cyclase isoform X1 n=1 Tax=Daphnia magna TaxID=35525 RepID=UPI001E1BCD14|nr:RNA 3'-terminal phosphate cyclase isoform X1 [Daphnia magna]